MRVMTGTYVSDGNRRTIDLGFRPSQVWVKGDSTQNIAWRYADGWCDRTNTMAASDSFLDGIAFRDTQLLIGAAASVNTSGTRYYWCAIGDDGSSDFDAVSYMGNGQAGNVLSFPTQKTPIALAIKRDSTLPAVLKTGASPSVTATGDAIAECVSALSAGAATLNAVNNVNEYSSASGLGEGINALAIYDGSNARVVTWFNASSGQFVDCGGDPLAAIIFRTDATGTPAYFVTRDMTGAAPVTATGIDATTASLAPGGIVLGSGTTLRTGAFSALVFCRKDTFKKISAPSIIVKNRKAIYLPGRGTAAQVDCGTSDATLKISGAISIEWYGIAWPDQYNAFVGVHLLERGVGPSATAGAYSWGLAAVQVQDSSWSGAQLAAITTTQWSEAAPLDAAVWRTGILMPWGRPAHIVHVHEGNGRHLMYLNGKLVKQRRINLATNIASGAGHRTGFGMRRNTADSAWTQAQRMLILSGRVYSSALTPDQVASRFAREVMGSSDADITANLAECWDANTASGLILPAQVDASNNGRISASARIVTL